jgi:hypothetical protein
MRVRFCSLTTPPTRRHINLYVDDTGAMKGLPDNTRAAGLAAAAGHPCDVHGDAFVARVVDCEEEFDRQDFTLKEVRSLAFSTRERHASCGVSLGASGGSYAVPDGLSHQPTAGALLSYPQVDSKADWISLAQARNAARRDNAKRLPELAPGATRIDAGAAAFEADAADAAVDVTQRAVPGKLYTYSQDGDEVVVEVKVPAATKSKDVSCAIKLDSIALSVATLPEGQREVMSGELFQVRKLHGTRARMLALDLPGAEECLLCVFVCCLVWSFGSACSRRSAAGRWRLWAASACCR